MVWLRNSCGTFVVFEQTAEAVFALHGTAALPGFIESLWKQQQVTFPLAISFAVIVRAVFCQHIAPGVLRRATSNLLHPLLISGDPGNAHAAAF